MENPPTPSHDTVSIRGMTALKPLDFLTRYPFTSSTDPWPNSHEVQTSNLASDLATPTPGPPMPGHDSDGVTSGQATAVTATVSNGRVQYAGTPCTGVL